MQQNICPNLNDQILYAKCELHKQKQTKPSDMIKTPSTTILRSVLLLIWNFSQPLLWLAAVVRASLITNYYTQPFRNEWPRQAWFVHFKFILSDHNSWFDNSFINCLHSYYPRIFYSVSFLKNWRFERRYSWFVIQQIIPDVCFIMYNC